MLSKTPLTKNGARRRTRLFCSNTQCVSADHADHGLPCWFQTCRCSPIGPATFVYIVRFVSPRICFRRSGDQKEDRHLPQQCSTRTLRFKTTSEQSSSCAAPKTLYNPKDLKDSFRWPCFYYDYGDLKMLSHIIQWPTSVIMHKVSTVVISNYINKLSRLNANTNIYKLHLVPMWLHVQVCLSSTTPQ